MNTAFYTSSVGTVQLQKGMDVVANNIANISTTGYKAGTTSFSDLLHTQMKGMAPNLKVGHGTKLEKTDTIFEQGMFRPTGRNLDYAIAEANGFFGVVNNGEMSFTRDGNFSLSEQPNGTFMLVSSRGGYVADPNGNPIIINDPSKLEETQLNIGTFAFENLDGLMRNEQGEYSVTDKSGNPISVTAETRRGYLEESTVNLPSEITNSIMIQRAFQMNARMVQIADEVEQTINNLR